MIEQGHVDESYLIPFQALVKPLLPESCPREAVYVQIHYTVDASIFRSFAEHVALMRDLIKKHAPATYLNFSVFDD